MRPKQFLLILIAVLGGVFADSALAAAKKQTAKKPAAAAPKKAAAAKPKAAPKTTTTKRRTTTRSRRRGSRPVKFVPKQAQPTKERFSEVQQALATQGYFTGDVNGEWKSDSIEALKQFQEDQSLRPTGKINSLSLIALGLGPKRTPMGALPGTQTPVAPEGAAEGVEEPAAVPAEPAVDLPFVDPAAESAGAPAR